MAKLLRIERAISWIARSLTANRDANPVPQGVIDQILPVVGIFGTQRLAEVNVATVQGGLGAIEVFHPGPDESNVRLYLSAQWSHDDAANRALIPGRIIPTSTGFPFAGFESEQIIGPLNFQAAREIWIGPLHRLAVQSDAMGAAARMILTVVWMEMPVGEVTRSAR